MRTIPARELKRRGVGAFGDLLEEGPLYVIKNDRPKYVLMTAEHFEEMVEDQHEAEIARVKASLAELTAGRVRDVTVEDLMDEFNLRDRSGRLDRQMTSEETLHKLIDRLPEHDVSAVEEVLARLLQRDSMLSALDGAPDDNELSTPEEDAEAGEAWQEYLRGEALSAEEAKRRLLHA